MIKYHALLLDRELTDEQEQYIAQRIDDEILSIQCPVPPEMVGKKVVVRSGFSSNMVGYVTHVKRTTFGFVTDNFSGEMPNHRFVSEVKKSYGVSSELIRLIHDHDYHWSMIDEQRRWDEGFAKDKRIRELLQECTWSELDLFIKEDWRKKEVKKLF